MNDLFLRAFGSKELERFPVWLMRQSGRYLSSYQQLRKKYSLKEIFTNPHLIYEATFLPLRQFSFDAAILFSDITILCLQMGLNLEFNEGPVITPKIQKKEDLVFLKRKQSLDFVFQAIRMLKKDLKVPLIGFAGGPFTVASYMIEDKHSEYLTLTKKWLYNDPEGFHELLEKITENTIEYLLGQIDAGVEAIQIFDSWASVLTPEHFSIYSLKYAKKIADRIRSKNIPILFFSRGSSVFAPFLKDFDGISFDWHRSLKDLRASIPSTITVQGNFDPDLLYAPFSVIEKTVKIELSGLDKKRVIINLGHGVKPKVSEEKVKCFVEAVQRC